MDLLDVARGPALAIAFAVFVLGTAWRLYGIVRLPRLPDLSPPREGAPSRLVAAWRANLRGLRPRRVLTPERRFAGLNAWVFHLGLAVVFLGYAPHIAFVRRHAGAHWPALPDGVMYLGTAITMIALGYALWLRLTDPARRSLSAADDFISWTITFLPFVTGMAVLSEPSARVLERVHTIYRGPLALHLLSLELLLVWFPFGKLMHAILFAFSRGVTGIRFAHRGVQW